MQIANTDHIFEIVIASLADVRAGRYEQAALRTESLDDSSFLLADSHDCLWLIWSSTHFSFYTLSSTMKRYVVPPDVLSRMHDQLDEAEALFQQGWQQDDVKKIFQSLELISSSAGEISHSAHFLSFAKKEDDDD